MSDAGEIGVGGGGGLGGERGARASRLGALAISASVYNFTWLAHLKKGMGLIIRSRKFGALLLYGLWA